MFASYERTYLRCFFLFTGFCSSLSWFAAFALLKVVGLVKGNFSFLLGPSALRANTIVFSSCRSCEVFRRGQVSSLFPMSLVLFGRLLDQGF